MYDIGGSLERQLLQVMRAKPTVVLTEPTEPRIVEAACHLSRFAKLVFLAPEAAVRAVAAKHLGHIDAVRQEFTFGEAAFVDPAAEDALLDEFAEECVSLPPELRRAESFEQLVDALPLTASGKIARKQIADLLKEIP